MDIFKGQNLLEFAKRFKTDTLWKGYVAELKDKHGYNSKIRPWCLPE